MEIFLFGSKIFKIISLSNQNDLTLPETILSFSSQGKSWCESSKRSSHNFMENKSTPKNYLLNQESDVLEDPVLERSHQEKMIREI